MATDDPPLKTLHSNWKVGGRAELDLVQDEIDEATR